MRNVVIVAAIAALARAGDERPLRFECSIPLEDVRGRIDHLALAPDGNTLAVAALGNDTIEIVDLRRGKVVHRIRDVDAPAAGAFIDGQLAMAAARDGKLHFFNGKTFQRIRSVDIGPDADPVRVDEHCQYVGFGAGAIAVVEKGAVWFTIKLAGHPEGFQLETKGPRIFVNVPDAGHVAVCDREKRAVVGEWRLDAKDNYPMALDEERGRVLVGCRTPPRLLALDMKDGSVKGSAEIGGDVDDIFLDPKARRIYASCGEGFVDVIDAGKYERVARVETAGGARTCLLDLKGNRLFVAAPGRLLAGAPLEPAAILVYRTAPASPPD
jgi:hypothetical protein